MVFGLSRMMAACVLMAALGGCVPEPGAMTPGVAKSTDPVAKPTEAKVIPNAYVAQVDAGIAVPAIPLEKLPVPLQRQTVYFPTEEAAGTIIINPAQRVLHLVTARNQAVRYGIAVGKAGFEWAGVANITDRKPWPTWTPPKEMIERKPELVQWEKGQPGGPTNPLGARALYLTTDGVDYGYRIHGTPDWQSIGSNASSGCIRMINQDVMDLYNRVPNGSKVIVLNADGSMPTALKLPPKPAKPAKTAKKAVPAVTPAPPPAPVQPVIAVGTPV